MIYHISMEKRHDKTGLRLGGVAKFGWYLQKAIPEIKLISWTDFPDWAEYRDHMELDLVDLMCEWLKEKVNESDIVIADGFWGRGLVGICNRLISVCHGTYFGRLIQYQLYPWDNPVGKGMVDAQKDFWQQDGVEIVCVAKQPQREVHQMGIKKETTLIYHGIDLDVYKPENRGSGIIHAASTALKGLDIIQKLARKHDIKAEFFNARTGILADEARRLNDAELIIAPSHYEGNSYFINEALACGIPVVSSANGMALEFDERCGIVCGDLSGFGFARQVKKALDGSYDPRSWAEENCSYERFANEWRKYLNIDSN